MLLLTLLLPSAYTCRSRIFGTKGVDLWITVDRWCQSTRPGPSGRGTGVLGDNQAYAGSRRGELEVVQTLPYFLLSLKTDA